MKHKYVIEPDGREYWLSDEDEAWLGMQCNKDSELHDQIVRECILSIANKSPEFYEGLGPDAWDDVTVDKIVFFCHHGLTGPLGIIIRDKLYEYLYSYHKDTIEENWITYTKGYKEEQSRADDDDYTSMG